MIEFVSLTLDEHRARVEVLAEELSHIPDDGLVEDVAPNGRADPQG